MLIIKGSTAYVELSVVAIGLTNHVSWPVYRKIVRVPVYMSVEESVLRTRFSQLAIARGPILISLVQQSVL